MSSMTSSRRVPLSIFDRYDAGKPRRPATSACLRPARSRARTSTSPRMRSSLASFVLVEMRSAPPRGAVMSVEYRSMRALFFVALFASIAYPVAEKHPVVQHYGEPAFTDNYQWLENAADPKVQAWVKAENALTR